MNKNNQNYQLGKKVSLITIFINSFLCFFKILTGILGKSTAMLADGIHTLSDILATFIVILGLKISNKEADKKHPYGHEKFEPLCTKFVSVILIITGLFIIYNSSVAIINKNFSTPGFIALIAALLSIIIKECMYWYTIITAKKIKSLSMEADAWHHRSDALSSIGTFLGILGARLGFKFLDPVAGLIVSFFILKVGIDFYLKAARELVDESVDENTLNKIKNEIKSVKGVINISNLKTRIFGNKIYVDTDVLVKSSLTVEQGHNIAELVHKHIENKIPNVKHCMVHIEPYYRNKLNTP